MKKTNFLKVCCLIAVCFTLVTVKAEQRIYWYGEGAANPAYTNYVADEVARISGPWMGWDNKALVANVDVAPDEGPTGNMYLVYTMANGYGYAGNHFVLRAGNKMDMSPVTSDWKFRFWLKANTKSFSLEFRDPTGDAHKVLMEIPQENLDGEWHLIEIPVYELEDKAPGFKYGMYDLTTDIAYLNITASGADGNTYAWDEMYFTDGKDTGFESTISFDYHYDGVLFTLANPSLAGQVYDATGKQVLSFVGEADMSHLLSGLYIVRVGNLAIKLVR